MRENTSQVKSSRNGNLKAKPGLTSQRGDETLREKSSVFETEINAVHQRYMEEKMDKISREAIKPEVAVAKQ